MKTIKVNGKILHEGDVVNTTEGRARLDYIGRQAFTSWTLLKKTNKFPFGRRVNIEDNYLNEFVLQK